MSYYSFMAPDWKRVHWIYGFEIDFEVIERIDKQRAFFAATNSNDEYAFAIDEDCFSDVTERVTDFLRQEFDCIAPMLGWDPDSPTKEKTYVLVVHAHSTPQRSIEKHKVMRRIARLKEELVPEVKAKAKWYFSCGAGVFKGNVDWDSTPDPDPVLMLAAHTRPQLLSRLLSAGLVRTRQRGKALRSAGVRVFMSTTAQPSSDPASNPSTLNFEVSPIPENPLGEGKWIKTAACLIIGDEILNGKTHDTNSNTFAKFCFEHGIELKRIEVIADEEEEIIEASRRMVNNYDFVITSGGIGPTHDDISYQSLAAAFNQRLDHHPETLHRMREMNKYRIDVQKASEEQRVARERMALFPEKAEVLFVNPELWVPVVRLEGKLCILPGIPSLFQRLLKGLTPYLPLPPPSERPFRHLIFTNTPESNIAPYLTALQKRVASEGVRIGSYPLFQKGVTVSLIGRDETRVRELGEEVTRELHGEVRSAARIGEEGSTTPPIPQ